MKLAKFRQITVLTALVIGSVACAPVIESHGYFPRRTTESKTVEEGSHSKQEIEALMGSPSTIAAFDENVWYYINTISHTYAWKPPVAISRNVTEIRFDAETGIIVSVRNYDIKDGKMVAFAKDVTPTRGRELSFLEQLLGNVGRVSAETFDSDQQGRDR